MTTEPQRFRKVPEAVSEAGEEGPLDAETARLAKLAVAVGAMLKGAVQASVRKAGAMGIPLEALEQVVALAGGTLDRIRPRGVSREEARVGLGLRRVAPSDGLRKWFRTRNTTTQWR